METLNINSINYVVDNKAILKNISIELKSKEICGIMGPSGAGKTTLFRLISGLIKPQNGEILLGATDLKRYSTSERPISYLQQTFPLYNSLTIFENVMIAFESKNCKKKKQFEKEAEEILNYMGIEKSIWSNFPKGLSGGETQRIALAKALLKPCKILLLDEPLSNIDKGAKRKLNNLIVSICKKKELIVIYISHSEDDLIFISDLIAFIENGKLIQIGTIEELLKNPKNGEIASIGSIVGMQFLYKKDFIKMNLNKDIFNIIPMNFKMVYWSPEKILLNDTTNCIKIENCKNYFFMRGKISKIIRMDYKIYYNIIFDSIENVHSIWSVIYNNYENKYKVGNSIFVLINCKDILFIDEQNKVMQNELL